MRRSCERRKGCSPCSRRKPRPLCVRFLLTVGAPLQMTDAERERELEDAPPSPVHNSGMPDIAEFKEKYGEDTWQPHYYEHYMKTRKKRAAAVQSSPAPNHSLFTAVMPG